MSGDALASPKMPLRRAGTMTNAVFVTTPDQQRTTLPHEASLRRARTEALLPLLAATAPAERFSALPPFRAPLPRSRLNEPQYLLKQVSGRL